MDTESRLSPMTASRTSVSRMALAAWFLAPAGRGAISSRSMLLLSRAGSAGLLTTGGRRFFVAEDFAMIRYSPQSTQKFHGRATRGATDLR